MMNQRHYNEWLLAKQMNLSTEIGTIAVSSLTAGLLSTPESYTPKPEINTWSPETTRPLGGVAVREHITIPRPPVGQQAEYALAA